MGSQHLSDHHVAVESSFPVCSRGSGDMRADLGDYGGSKSHVGNEVAVHDIDMEPAAP